jgi:peptidoglycan/LPS O-acetylase OafA/YrhL
MAHLYKDHLSVKTAQRSHSIDALRGLAALVIVLYHARPMFWVGIGSIWSTYGVSFHPNALLGYLSMPLSFGGLAVDVFFVLSGYCIHRKGASLLAKDPKYKLNIKNYFSRRIFRIYPVYIAALCLTGLVHFYVAAREPALVVGQDNSWFSFLISLLSLQGIFAPSFAHNGVFWTLAIEIHFYLIYPVIYWMSSKKSSLFVLILLAAFSFSYLVLDSSLGLSTSFPYKGSGGPLFIPYLFTWGIGIYLAELESGRASPRIQDCFPRANISDIKYWTCLIATSFLIVLCTATKKISLAEFLLVPMSCGFLVYLSTTPRGEAFWSRSWGKLLAWIGLFSYSLYATHRPFLLLVKSIVDPLDQRSESLLGTFLATLICLCLAFLFFCIFERWTLKSPSSLKLAINQISQR